MKSILFCCVLVFCVGNSHYYLRNKYSNDDYGDKEWDWRKYHPISSVDNELVTNCSSSYVFAGVGAIEGLETLHHGNSQKISSQEYLDCSGRNNCKIGSISDVIEYYSDKKVCSSDSYEYDGKIEECMNDKCNRYTTAGEVSYYMLKGEEAIKGYVHVTPVPTKIYIDSLKDYHGGIYKNYDECNHEPNHWVLVVGYGSEGEDKYWIIKNDFGAEWGEQGYFRLERGKGMCGIGKESYLLYLEEWKTWAIVAIVIVCLVGLILIICCCCCCIMCITGTSAGIGWKFLGKRNKKTPVHIPDEPNVNPTENLVEGIRVN